MSDNQQPMLPVSPFNPLFPQTYLFANMPGAGLMPYECTDWRDETCSWKETCYLNSSLNPTPTHLYTGPDIVKFLTTVCCTGFKKFPVGKIKHGLMVNDNGKVIQDGVLWRQSEDSFTSYWMSPCLNYALESGRYGDFDVKVEDLTGKVFLLQIGGPTSIDSLEEACGESLRDVKFLYSKDVTIAGKQVKIARIGMAGTLSYEVHGKIEDCYPVYNAIWEAGQHYGMRRLGQHCYGMNHAENGYPQYTMHFLYPWTSDPEMMGYMAKQSETAATDAAAMMSFHGSNGDNVDAYYYDPYELGWGKTIRFDHDFVGKEALEKIADQPHRRFVTLEWDPDEVGEIFADQFRGSADYYTPIEEPNFPVFTSEGMQIAADIVEDANGKRLGVSTGRQNSAYFHRMISICCIDPDYAEEGTEVFVIWGDAGTKQKRVRAKVTRFPYNNVLRNETTDVSTLPKAKRID
jgi:vanillate/3-O-methylgallate O-demethylase